MKQKYHKFHKPFMSHASVGHDVTDADGQTENGSQVQTCILTCTLWTNVDFN